LQQKLLDRTSDNYQIQSYLQHLLYTPEALKKNLLKLGLYYQDQSGSFDAVRRNRDANEGEYFRTTKAMSSAVFRMQGRINIDCFNVSRPLVENVSVLLQFTPNKPENCLVSTIVPAISHIIEIQECYLKVSY
jgi:hypothetical protein